MQTQLIHLWKAAFLLGLLTAGRGSAGKNCTDRRCLAQMLVKKTLFSQPQQENCTIIVNVPFMEYQTLSVDTKKLRLNSRLIATLSWNDPQLAWDTSVYQFDQVVLPVVKLWRPKIYVTNGLATTFEDASDDLLVHSNGTLRHSVIISAEVDCEVNLFNYPFAADECPVAVQSWAYDGCGTSLTFGDVIAVDGSHGDWETPSVTLLQQRDDRYYIMVALRIKYINPFITLLLPSILIVLADVVSFALPLGGGERNSFKVTLVLSFTMFLLILNEVLPGDSKCSPIIRTHFCICLVILVLSMLVSMVLTRLAQDGSLMICCCPKDKARKKKQGKDQVEDEEVKADISVVQLPDGESETLKKILSFLQDYDKKTQESEEHQQFADKVDQTFFWFYLVCATAYFIAMILVMVKYKCKVNHFEFWY